MKLAKPKWQYYKVSPDETHHTVQQKPAYEKRFLHVLKFHFPGIAPVVDESGAYHIDLTGDPIYKERYTRTFGFYCNRAAVKNDQDWFHILPDGKPLYKKHYGWCGNYQESMCAVKDQTGCFFHIDEAGVRAYPESYSYVGDFHEGIAVAQNDQGLHIHIDQKGKRIHQHEFIDLDVFHKGFARAKDTRGWVHITRSGTPIYQQRYTLIEPFYNGIARVETKWGELQLINEDGDIIQSIRPPLEDPFHKVSGDLVSFWRLFTLKAAQDLKIFQFLPNNEKTLAKNINLSQTMTKNILLALMEMDYVTQIGEKWEATRQGSFLLPSHPHCLEKAQKIWMSEHFESWQDLTYSLKNEKSSFEKRYQIGWFDFLENHPEKRKTYHQALSKYAERDYTDVGEKIDFTAHLSIADIGGSTGSLLKTLLNKYPHLSGHLLDLPSVLEEIKTERMQRHPLNFFKTWPTLQVDAAILCRILHDWPDEKALHILKQAQVLLKKSSSSRLYIVENLLNKKTGSGALLNLNMLVMTGSQERTFEEFILLFKKAGYVCLSTTRLNEVSSIMALKPL